MADDLRVMVVDDEPLAVERLQLLLARLEGVTVAGSLPLIPLRYSRTRLRAQYRSVSSSKMTYTKPTPKKE